MRYRDTTPFASGRTASIRSRCRALNHIGRPTRHSDDRGAHSDVERDPPHPREAVAAEVRADRELVSERQSDREIGVEVHGVPRLTGQPPPGGARWTSADGQEEREARRST